MKFPSVKDIATTTVVTIGIDALVSKALEDMLRADHRDIIIVDGDTFRVLTVLDILNMQCKHENIDIPLSSLDLKIVPTIQKNKNILDTVEFLNNNVEYLCVVDEHDQLFGLITHTDITTNIDPDTLMENYRLSDLLKHGRRMKWVDKNTKTVTLLQEMTESLFDNAVIVEDMVPIGILTTKDIMKLIRNKDDLNLHVSKYMNAPVETIHKDSSIREALTFVKSKHYKRAIVVDDNNKLMGIITQKELISLSYSRWAMLMKEYQEELSEINNMLKDQNKEFETLASIDALTGLYNRHKFAQLYITSYQTMVQRHNEMALMVVDIDFFKKINDTYGHNEGDNVLIQVSHALLKSLRNIDIVCRWGGEEFVILLPTASMKNAAKLAEKLRAFIEQYELDVVKQITVSIGVAQVNEGDEMQDVIDRADKALYLAKQSGRNCVKTQAEIKE